ncbi:MAG: 4-alpha-glucanotransferase [Mastigocoleus sp. MO_167.B18]|uniref:4-alpha-glucanotransferase n=1 Tax=Mastigocoleus sp. MO_188.B34 TaxID=3036635 RepID=UPI002608A71A|nr:4-alpha-glucanotransferase [Mastigocoleus sp. MO_188.B34]MDJ0693899.1 4-alpha-glucanotransferase [Mastigocoleus sp. MO_188.B34]MDJ0772902.1 4-alpha-glucanotransferase [Mastigocoleus sp. MO_167.B18]
MPFPRSSGILLHPTCFPSRFGIGDLGADAYRFIDFLQQSNQQYWQILPLGPTGYGNSPYMCYSAIAGNPLLISPEKLKDEDLLAEEDFDHLPAFPGDRVDYQLVIDTKIPLLQKACNNFKHHASPEKNQEFADFCSNKAYWLDDFALFMALKDRNEDSSWRTWEAEIARHEPEAIQKAQEELSENIFYYKFVQYEFFRQWSELKTYANERGVNIIGDIPIYVAHDSADVWANREIFCLDEETGEAAEMAGVPPDYFSATGQLWGNPVYNWEALQEQDFHWWLKRFEAMLDYVDIIRIDHFRGFEAFWSIPQGEETAVNGEWVKAPGDELFETIRQKLGKLPVLAEDLGTITPEVLALRDKFDFPGMKVLQFAFGSDPANPYLPFNVPQNCVIYTGTHDNDTTIGWYNTASDWEKRNLWLYLGSISPDGINWDLIRLALSSVANQAIIPLQDILGLSTQARMNIPSRGEGNWEWRYYAEALNEELSDRLKNLTILFGRASENS